MQNRTRKNRSADAEILLNYLDSRPYRDYRETKKMIMQACQVPVSTLTNWVYGPCKKIPLRAKIEINKITLSQSGKEIFTITEPEEKPKA